MTIKKVRDYIRDYEEYRIWMWMISIFLCVIPFAIAIAVVLARFVSRSITMQWLRFVLVMLLISGTTWYILYRMYQPKWNQ